MRPQLITLLCACTPLVIYVFTNRYGILAPNAVPGMTVQQIAAAQSAFADRFSIVNAILFFYLIASPVILPFLHRRLAAPHIRAAANSLGLSNVCTRCGYNLSGHTTTTPPTPPTPQSLPQRCPPQVCPECGTPRTIPQSLPASCPPPAATPNAAAHTPARDEPAA